MFEIKHLDDEVVSIGTAPGEVVKHMEVKCVQGKGMPFYKETMYRGNLYIKFDVKFPEKKSLSNEAKQ